MIMNVWQAVFNKYHLKLNILKTEVMMMSRSRQTLNIKIGDHTLNQVQSFKYLGSTLNEQSKQEDEIKNRIAKYSQNVGCVYMLRKDRNVPKKAKQIIHQTILRPILIFGSEWWTLTKRLEQQITTADMKVIRMIQGVTRWGRTRDEDVNKQSIMLPIVQVINKNKLRWFGYVIRRRRLNAEGCNEVKDEGKDTKRKTNTKLARYMKGRNPSLKEVLETKCFENRKDWRTWVGFLLNRQEFRRRPVNSYVDYGERGKVRYHLHIFVGQSSPSFPVLSVFHHVRCQFIFFHIFPGVVDPNPPTA